MQEKIVVKCYRLSGYLKYGVFKSAKQLQWQRQVQGKTNITVLCKSLITLTANSESTACLHA